MPKINNMTEQEIKLRLIQILPNLALDVASLEILYHWVEGNVDISEK